MTQARGMAPVTRRLDERIEAFLATGPKPIYVGFGSMSDDDPDGTTRAIVEAADRADVRVVLGSGWAALGKSSVPDRVLVVDHVPHGCLFPRLAGAVHHGGAGTTAATARSGIPQLIVPHMVDQRRA